MKLEQASTQNQRIKQKQKHIHTYIPSQVLESRLNHSENVADAGQPLQAVVDADEAIIARLRGQVVLLHHVGATRRDCGEVADAPLGECAEGRAALLTAGAGLDAAADDELALYR
jgi:hypothetical protein